MNNMTYNPKEPSRQREYLSPEEMKSLKKVIYDLKHDKLPPKQTLLDKILKINIIL